jgi:hypothetical protein
VVCERWEWRERRERRKRRKRKRNRGGREMRGRKRGGREMGGRREEGGGRLPPIYISEILAAMLINTVRVTMSTWTPAALSSLYRLIAFWRAMRGREDQGGQTEALEEG